MNFRAYFGDGVAGQVRSEDVPLGNLRLLQRLRVEPGDFPNGAESLRREAQTVMFVVKAQRVVGLLGVVDPVKTSTPAALQALRASGIHVVESSERPTRPS